MRARTTGIWAAALFWLIASVPAYAGPTLLFELSTGKVLYSEDVDEPWHPASLTKIMTAYLSFEAVKEGKLHLDDKISCSELAAKQPPSKAGINIGGTLTVEKALKALIVKSANDVAVMLAEAVAGNESAFVDRMNATARRLGMTNTHFSNANGLPEPDIYTTARDLAKLTRAVLSEYPQYESYWSMPAMHIGKRRLGSHNALLKTFPGADGLKTGFTCDSGYNVVATATRDGRRLVAIVLGETSSNERAIRSASLLEYGFQYYGWKDLFNTTTLENLPEEKSAKGLISIRKSVKAWSCNPHEHKHKKQSIAHNKNSKKKPAKSADAH
jgi:D-alanyl-D-alanine carboxypeptidase